MKPTHRIALKISWLAVLVLVLALFGREVVEFVYTGF
jgi:hypothetical protein